MLALLVSSLIVPCIRRRRIPPAGAFHPGEAAIPGEVIYSAPFSSAHLIHPGSSPHPSHGSPSHPGKQAGRARRRAVIGGSRHRHRIPAPSRLRPVSPLVSACGAKSVSFPSVPCRHRARASPHRSPWLKRFNHSSARARSHPGQTSRQGRPVPVPPLVSAGGKSSARPPYRFSWPHQSARRTSKQARRRCPSSRPVRLIRSSASLLVSAGGAVSSVSPSRLVHSGRGTGRGSAVSGSSSGSLLMEEGQVLGPSPLLVLFCCGSSANRSYRPCSE